MPLTHDAVLQALSTVLDPDLQRDLVSLGMVKDVQLKDGAITVGIELTTPACPMKDRIQADIEQAIRTAAGEDVPIEVVFTAQVRAAPTSSDDAPNPLPGVKHVIAVGAGKGGVGKSTVSTFLATGLARLGASVGLLDGDIYGPSLSTMLGLDDLQATANGNILDPFEVHGIKAMSIAKLVDPEKAMIWRGPMAHKAFSQLVLQTDWGELDYLIVDLPPGTGDVPLSLAQLLPLSGSVVVCTPQRVAIDDARRAVRMFQQLNVDVLGVVENMSWFVGDDGKEYDLFGRGGAEQMAEGMSMPFLGAIPLHMNMRINADQGTPLGNFEINDDITGTLLQTCRNLAQQVSINTMQSAGRPTLTISGSQAPAS
ncbi:MAG: Mrp/NBP35 family ATP-binding protein [Phycisphaerales bacterium]|nr:Mrp/NBP35 family ATP-binding protein [Phycisphaerales bacterium]